MLFEAKESGSAFLRQSCQEVFLMGGLLGILGSGRFAEGFRYMDANESELATQLSGFWD